MGLLYSYRKRWQKKVDSVASEIRAYNARSGYDLSVDKEDLAGDLLFPLQNGYITQFAENNDVPYSDYRKGLEETIDKPSLRWGYLLHILGVLYTFTGITYMMSGGFVSATAFLFSVIILFLMSLGLYLVL